MTADDITVRAVRSLIEAINAGDRDAFMAVLAPDATMSDDGTERDLVEWIDREIFTATDGCRGDGTDPSTPIGRPAPTLDRI